MTPSSAPFSSMLCLKRSPQVAPVTESSGKVRMETFDFQASSIMRHISSELCLVSATFTAGTAAAVRISPKLFIIV